MVPGCSSSAITFVFAVITAAMMVQVIAEEDGNFDEDLLYNSSIPVPMLVQPRHISRIIGGKPTSIKVFPWQVRIIITKLNTASGCGGSILSTTWILSAAHCFAKGVPDEFSEEYAITANKIDIYAGLSRLSQKHSDRAVQIRTINAGEIKDRLFVHEDYKVGAQANNDIALIKLRNPLTFNEKIKLIKLAQQTDFIPGKAAIASGWGSISDNPNIRNPDLLQYVDGLKLISKEECKRYWRRSVTEKNICHLTRNKNVCSGDSGGALITGVGSSNGPPFVQIGINSFVYGTNNRAMCEAHWPGVFVDVTLPVIKKWITDTMSGTCSDKYRECSIWTGRGYCRHTYVTWMEENCPKSCNKCKGSCSDKSEGCRHWKSRGYCRHSYVTWMKKHCPKTCNFC